MLKEIWKVLQILLNLVRGNSETATKLATARKIILSGAVSGSASFNGSGDITITTSYIKSLVDYLYLLTYTNNSMLISMVKSLGKNVLQIYLSTPSTVGSDSTTTQMYYWQQMESYCVGLVRLLITLLPTSNTYRTLLNTWITNYDLSSTEREEAIDTFTAQKIGLLINAGSSKQSTFKIESTNYSLPNIISKLRATL